MEQRVLEVTVVSAEGLKDVSHLGKLRAYAEVWVDPSAKEATPLDTEGGTSPAWNHTLSFTAPDASFHHPSARLTLHILHKTHLPGRTSFIGSSAVPLSDLLASSKTLLSLPVLRSSGRAHGSLCVRIHLGDKHVADPSSTQGTHLPVMAYPAYPEMVNGRPRFLRYPNSYKYLPKGYPAVPYYPPPGVVVPSTQQ